eukprot:2139799-Rhodomonas_salina.1
MGLHELLEDTGNVRCMSELSPLKAVSPRQRCAVGLEALPDPVRYDVAFGSHWLHAVRVPQTERLAMTAF